MKKNFLALISLFAGAALFAEINVNIDATSPREASKGMYGIFFEEINRAGAGGIEANMIENGSFEDNSPPPPLPAIRERTLSALNRCLV